MMLGIDIGGTKLLAVTGDESGAARVVGRRRTTRAFTPLAAVDAVRTLIDDVETAQGEFVTAVGIGFPGVVDAGQRVVRSSVIIDGWHDVELAKMVEHAVGVPCVIDNDVNNAARSEARLHARDVDSMVFVSAGTGIGGALVINRKVWTGTSGVAGEVGHIVVDPNGPTCQCGRRGCVGALAGGERIERQLGLGSGELERFIVTEPDKSRQALTEAGALLGSAMADLLNVLNPELLILGGGLARNRDYFLAAESAVRSSAFSEAMQACRFEPPRGGYESAAVGASLLAAEAIGAVC